MPTFLQVQAALQTLAEAGWTLTPPAQSRLQLCTVEDIATLLVVSPNTARSIARSLPHTVMLPGGDLRIRMTDVEEYVERHRLPKAAA